MSSSKNNANPRPDIRAAVASHNRSFGWALGRHFRELDRSKRLHWAGHDSK